MIKVLTENDVDAFIKIRMAGLRISPMAFGASLEEGIDRSQTIENLKNWTDDYFTLGYFERGQLVGIVGFIREKKLKKNHKAIIWGMFVDPNFRGKGIASQLMQDVISRAKKIEGLSKILLSVTQPQENALRFYEKLGFVKYSVEKDAIRVDGQKIDEIFMSLNI